MEFDFYIESEKEDKLLIRELGEKTSEMTGQPVTFFDYSDEWNATTKVISLDSNQIDEDYIRFIETDYGVKINKNILIEIAYNDYLLTEEKQWFEENGEPSEGLKYIYEFINEMYLSSNSDFLFLDDSTPIFFRKSGKLFVFNSSNKWTKLFSEEQCLNLLKVPYNVVFEY
ncbi:hypothetical protein ACYSNR_18135 [Enterococcus sp. LJL128]